MAITRCSGHAPACCHVFTIARLTDLLCTTFSFLNRYLRDRHAGCLHGASLNGQRDDNEHPRKQRHRSVRRMKPSIPTAVVSAAIMLGLAGIAQTASATLISATYVSQPGAQDPVDKRDLGATATFEYDDACTTNCALVIELTNTEPMTGISQGLTDFHFSSTSLTGLALTG